MYRVWEGGRGGGREGGRAGGRAGGERRVNYLCTAMVHAKYDINFPIVISLTHLPSDPVPLMIPETVAVALWFSFSDL